MSRVPPGPQPVGLTVKASVPWWVLPAIVLAGFVGALMARWLDSPVPAAAVVAPKAQLPAPFQAVPAASLAAAAAPASAPSAIAPPSEWVLSGVLMVDGRPAMALVGVGRSAAALQRVGDRLTATAVLASIEANAIWVQDGAVRTRVAVSAPGLVPNGSAMRATTPLSTPEPRAAEGPALPPATGDAPGSGNAAFRAAIEDKIRTLQR